MNHFDVSAVHGQSTDLALFHDMVPAMVVRKLESSIIKHNSIWFNQLYNQGINVIASISLIERLCNACVFAHAKPLSPFL